MLPPRVYLLDTSVIVHYVRNSALAEWVRAAYQADNADTSLLVSIVSAGEIHSLALQLGWGSVRRQRLEAVLDTATIVPLDYPRLVSAYARIDAHCRRMGAPIGENDTWIAATAHVTGARLLTTDRDFDHLTPTFLTRDWIDPQQHR